MNQQHSDNEQESLRSQRMTEDEARAVIDLWQQEETDNGGLTNRPAVTDVAEGLGVHVEDVQRLLAQVRARSIRKKPSPVKAAFQISPPPREELAETTSREAQLHAENVQFRRRVLALVAATGVTIQVLAWWLR